MRPGSTALHPGRTRAARWAVLLAAATIAIMAAAVSLTWSAAAQAGPGMTTEEQKVMKEVRAIATMLRAPCCPNLTVSQHNSPTTMRMKKEIAEMVREGKGRSAIIAEMKANYGDEIAPSLIPALWKPYLYIGGPILLLALLAILGRWLFTHEKSPTVLHVGGLGGSPRA